MPVPAVILGLLVGLVIGGLGGGGGVLTVPLLVYALGQPAQDATTGSVIIVGIAAAVGVVARLRGGIDWRTGLAFGMVGIPAAYLGTLLNRQVSDPVLLLAFATLTLLAAAAMLLDGRRCRDDELPADGSGSRPAGGTGTAVATRPDRLTVRGATTKILVCGVVVGFLTGFLGVGGGFLVVPALVVMLRMSMPMATGTALLIIVLNALSSVASRVGALDLDWRVVAPFTVAAAIGTLLGQRVAGRLSGAALTRSFAVMLALVGLVVGVESIASL